jgi:hypothetical protein
VRVLLIASLCITVACAVGREGASAAATCTPTVPTRSAPPGVVDPTAAGFNFGTQRLRVQLGWPKGRLAAGIRPDGGSLATVEEDGSIHAKVGWWRGVAGRLTVTGRRLDAAAPPLTAHVPSGYDRTGFQPTGLVFPSTGCWRVEGRVGAARLTFVVKVTKLRRH